MIPEKFCVSCERTLPIEKFRQSGKNGRRARCRDCTLACTPAKDAVRCPVAGCHSLLPTSRGLPQHMARMHGVAGQRVDKLAVTDDERVKLEALRLRATRGGNSDYSSLWSDLAGGLRRASA